MSIPERLVEIREKHGYTRKRLSEELGKPYATITKYETGEREPGHKYIIEIAKKFGVTTDYILGMETARIPEPAEFAEMSDLELLKTTLGRLGLLTPDGDLSDEDFSLMLEFFKFIEFRANNRNHSGSK